MPDTVRDDHKKLELTRELGIKLEKWAEVPVLPNNLQCFPTAKSTKSRPSDGKQACTIHLILGHSLASAWFLTTSLTLRYLLWADYACTVGGGGLAMTYVGSMALVHAEWASSGLLGSQHVWPSARTWHVPSLSPDVLADKMEVNGQTARGIRWHHSRVDSPS